MNFNNASISELSMRLLIEGKEPLDVIKEGKKKIKVEPEDEIKIEEDGCSGINLIDSNKHEIIEINGKVYVILHRLQEHPLDKNIMVMYGYSINTVQPWVNELGIIDQHAKKLKDKQSFCLLFIKFNVINNLEDNDITVNQKLVVQHRWMVISKGCGRHIINQKDMELGFGLYAVINMIDFENVTALGYKSTVNKNQSYYANNPSGGKIDGFRMDLMDILKKTAGKPLKDDDAEISIDGKDMLKVKLKEPTNLHKLTDLCTKYYNKFKEEKTDLPFLLSYKRVTNKKISAALETNLTTSIHHCIVDDKDFVLLTYPFTKKDIINGNVKFMNFGSRKQKIEYDDLSLKNYLDEIRKNNAEKTFFEDNQRHNYSQEIMERLNKHFVQANDIDGNIAKLSIKRCLSYNTEFEGIEYLLQDGIWYQMNQDMKKELSRFFENRIRNSALPSYDQEKLDKKISSKMEEKISAGEDIEIVLLPHNKTADDPFRKLRDEKENKYNKHVADIYDSYLCLDRKMIYIGIEERKDNKFEFCDILTKNGELIHVKFRGDIHDQGHLFNQGIISAKLMKTNKKVREDVYTLIKNEWNKKMEEKRETIKRKSGKQKEDETDQRNEIEMKSINEKEGEEFVTVIKSRIDSTDIQDRRLVVCFAIIAKLKVLRLPALILFYYATKKIEEHGFEVKFEWITDITPDKVKEPKPKRSKNVIKELVIETESSVIPDDSPTRDHLNKFQSDSLPSLFSNSQNFSSNISLGSNASEFSSSSSQLISNMSQPTKRKKSDSIPLDPKRKKSDISIPKDSQ